MDADLIAALDGIAGRAVPASEVREIGGWLARRSPELATKRVNSVLARSHDRERSLERKLSAVEFFYGARGLPARYQITPAAQPSNLPELLRRRGYAAHAPTAVYTGKLAPLARTRIAPGVTAELASQPSDVWWALWQESSEVDLARRPAVEALFRRIQRPTAFAAVSIDGEAAAAALGVLDQPWLGIFNMATVPAKRRRGAGRTALAALARWAQGQRATIGYLQVALDNQPALRFYSDAGFGETYRYVYLSCETPA